MFQRAIEILFEKKSEINVGNFWNWKSKMIG